MIKNGAEQSKLTNIGQLFDIAEDGIPYAVKADAKAIAQHATAEQLKSVGALDRAVAYSDKIRANLVAPAGEHEGFYVESKSDLERDLAVANRLIHIIAGKFDKDQLTEYAHNPTVQAIVDMRDRVESTHAQRAAALEVGAAQTQAI